MCSKADEAMNHIVNECLKLAQKEYKRSFNQIGRYIHWEICGTNGIHVKLKQFEHQPEAFIENELCKNLCDSTVQTDHFIIATRCDMIVIDKEHHECQITDSAILYDTKVDDKEVGKIAKYLDLAR